MQVRGAYLQTYGYRMFKTFALAPDPNKGQEETRGGMIETNGQEWWWYLLFSTSAFFFFLGVCVSFSCLVRLLRSSDTCSIRLQ